MKFEKQVEKYPELDDSMTAADYVEFWQFARLLTGGEMLGLLSFAEILESTQHPLHHLTKAFTAWMSVTRDEIAKASKEAADDAVVH